VLKRAVELDARLAPIQYHLGVAYARLGRKDEAVGALRRALQIDDRFPDADAARRLLKELGAS